MNHPDNQAFPLLVSHPNGIEIYSGLSVREYTAIHILASAAWMDFNHKEKAVEHAVACADLLIKKLNERSTV